MLIDAFVVFFCPCGPFDASFCEITFGLTPLIEAKGDCFPPSHVSDGKASLKWQRTLETIADTLGVSNFVNLTLKIFTFRDI